MKPLALLALVVFPLLVNAQTEKFDILTYQPPQGWKKETADFAISYVKVNNDKGTWCRLAVYKSINSSGNPDTDFTSEWRSMVKPDTYVGAIQPQPQVTQADGWTTNAGGSIFKWQGSDATIVLATISGYGKVLSIVVSMNSDSFMDEIEKFMGSMKLDKGEQPAASPITNQPTSPNPPPSHIAVSDKPGMHGITVSITNFDDGWTAQPFADYVKVTKGPVTVLLHYAIAINDEMRNANDMAAWFWDHMIPSRYQASNIQVFQNEPFTYNKVYFVEGDAKQLSTGASVRLGLRILVNNGIARCIEIIAPNAAEFKKEFPDQDKIGAMGNYNKFAVSKEDLPGTWEESSSSGLDMYNTTTGAYAGMNTVATAASFTFNNDGNYNSHHSGASGMVGSMKFFDQKYNGKYTVTFWELSMTNRWEGKTETYFCQFEAVRGGRALYLVNKAATGITYYLVKKK